MNASAAALPREDEVQSKVRKVRAFGRNARFACAVLFGLGWVGIGVLPLIIFLTHGSSPDSGNGGPYDVLTAAATPLQFKVWALLLLGVGIGVWLATVHQLYRLFGNLAAGAIYTAENVRRVRYVGLLWLLLAVLNIAVPAALLVAHRFIGASVPIDLDRWFPSFSELFNSFVAAGLVLLVSWIMDVGLYEKDNADVLRREADLTI